jgi:hypothetical protein
VGDDSLKRICSKRGHTASFILLQIVHTGVDTEGMALVQFGSCVCMISGKIWEEEG